MPIEYSVAGRILVLNMSGAHTPQDMRDVATRVARDPQVPKPFHLLVDVRHSAMAPAAAELETRARALHQILGERPGRIAILIGDDLRYGLARVVEAHLEPHGVEVRPFRDAGAATAWLDTGAV